jgi:hypothetical protein
VRYLSGDGEKAVVRLEGSGEEVWLPVLRLFRTASEDETERRAS